MKQKHAMAAACAALAIAAPALADDRDIQFSAVDLENRVVELHNFSEEFVDLSFFRFCTHDFNELRKYTVRGGMDGIGINPGQTLFFHWEDDAPVGQPDHYNISDIIGAYAQPLAPRAYALEMFFPGEDGITTFGGTVDFGDHLQWAVDPENVGSATNRSEQAVFAGLWTDAEAFIVVRPDTLRIELLDTTGGELHGPAGYAVINPCLPDLNGDDIVDNGDIAAFLGFFLAQDPGADFNGDGIIDNGDIAEFVALFLAGC